MYDDFCLEVQACCALNNVKMNRSRMASYISAPVNKYTVYCLPVTRNQDMHIEWLKNVESKACTIGPQYAIK